MGNAVLGFPNLIEQATLSGGSWLTSLPLGNIQNRLLSIVARSSSLLPAATTFDLEMPDADNVKVFSLIGHNLSSEATVRLIGSVFNDFATLDYDSGAVEVWPAVFSPGATNWENRTRLDGKYADAEKRDYTWTFVHLLPRNVASRYWRVEIADAGNTNGYVQIGRVFIGSAWQPVINMNFGANLGWETDTQTQRARSGALYFDRKTPRRAQRFTLEHMEIDEALGNAFEIQRQAGIDGDVLFIYDPADTAHSLRRRFLGRLRELSPIEDPYPNHHSTNFIIEELTPAAPAGSGRKTYLSAALLSNLGLTIGTGTATFTRASAKYGVDADSFWTKALAGVPVFEAKGIDMEPLSTNKCLCYGVPRADALGSELNTNVPFTSTIAPWTGTSWVWESDGAGGGRARRSPLGGAALYSSTLVAVAGKFYQFVLTVGGMTAGTLSPKIGASGVVPQVISSNGTYTLFAQAATGGVVYINTSADFDGYINNISVKEAIDYVGTKAYHDGTAFQNPITGMTLSGDVAAVLSIVTDQTALEAMTVDQLDRVVNAWKVYKLVTGANAAAIAFTGAAGNTNIHTPSVIIRGTGTCDVKTNTGSAVVTALTDSYIRRSKNVIPTAVDGLIIFCSANTTAYFLLPQLEELPFATSIMPTEGATAGRAADILSFPLAGNIPLSGARHIPTIYWTPRSVVAGREEVIAYSGTSAANCVKVVSNGTSIRFEKVVASVSEAATLAITPVVGTTYRLDAWINANNTMNLKVNSALAGTNTSTTAVPVFGTDIFIGSDSVNAINGQIMSLAITN